MEVKWFSSYYWVGSIFAVAGSGSATVRHWNVNAIIEVMVQCNAEYSI
jgi:hypothetical protein